MVSEFEMAIDGSGAGGPGMAAPGGHGESIANPAYTGNPTEIGAIVGVNFVLSMVTLGFYRFWGKTRVRSYLWSRISLYGDRLEYTGLGKELFIGFLIAMAILIPLFGILTVLDFYLEGRHEIARIVVQVVQGFLLLYLFPVAIFRAARYRLSRTTWRGIRFGLTGTGTGYAVVWLLYGALALVSLGLAMPVLRTRLQRYLTTNMWLGDRQFDFDARARDLMGRWLLCLLLFLPTLGLSYLWYKAYEISYFTGRTSCGNLRFRLTVTGGNLVAIYGPYVIMLLIAFAVFVVFLTNFIDVPALWQNPVTLSLAQAGVGTFALAILLLLSVRVLAVIMVTHRLIGLFTRQMEIFGEEDFDAIAQSGRSIPSRGEGLADALDVGGI
jgi:uncharacterized membrane protein YjgN (DUF898 family)